MNLTVRSTCAALLLMMAATLIGGCDQPPPPYGVEHQLFLPGGKRQVWAVAPVINLSGQKSVDPLLQADLVYQQLQQVHGLTVIPVNRVVEVLAGLKLEKVQSPDQAVLVCDLLGCDALVVATVTVYDPYDPPKFGGSLQVFAKPAGFVRPPNIDVHQLSRAAAPVEDDSLPPPTRSFAQSVCMFDSTNGSVREAVASYAKGRHDPVGPLGEKEYFSNMDRYSGFAYDALIVELLKQLEPVKKK